MSKCRGWTNYLLFFISSPLTPPPSIYTSTLSLTRYRYLFQLDVIWRKWGKWEEKSCPAGAAVICIRSPLEFTVGGHHHHWRSCTFPSFTVDDLYPRDPPLDTESVGDLITLPGSTFFANSSSDRCRKATCYIGPSWFMRKTHNPVLWKF